MNDEKTFWGSADNRLIFQEIVFFFIVILGYYYSKECVKFNCQSAIVLSLVNNVVISEDDF